MSLMPSMLLMIPASKPLSAYGSPERNRPGRHRLRSGTCHLLTVCGIGALFGIVQPVLAGQVAPPGQEAIGTDAAFFRGVAENPTNPLEIRRVALTRLLKDPQPAGRAAVRALFGESVEAVRAGLVAALANAPVEAPELADAIALAAAEATPADRPAWIVLLGLAGPGMDALLVELIKDQTVSGDLRGNAVELLGGFSTPLAAETLMDVAESDDAEDLRTSAFEALRRLSGMPFGDAADAWRAWWAAGGEELLEATCEQRAETLAARLERADRDRRTARTLADRAVEQLRQVHGELLLGMDSAARQERILRLLENDFEGLRRLAVEQIERMLRNGDRIDDPGIPPAIERLLDDRSPSLRAKAASLVGTLSPDRVLELVSTRLRDERDPVAAGAYLEAMMGVPDAGTMDAVVIRLGDAATADAAARALVRMHAAGAEAGAWTFAAASAARTRLDEAASPVMAELLAIAGGEMDDERLRTLLGSEDPRLRRAVADGWGRRGRIAELRERSDDPVVYPALASAIVDGQAPLEALETLLVVSRSPESSADFERVVTRLLESVPLDQVSVADRLLADSTPVVSSALRRRGLRRVVDAPGDSGLATEARIEAVERLGRLLIDASQPADAVQIVRPQLPLAPERLGPLLFEALVLAAEFDAAASRQSAPGAWVALLARIGDAAASRREAIAREIAKRFASDLDESQWETMRRIVPSLGLSSGEVEDGSTSTAAETSEPNPGSGG